MVNNIIQVNYEQLETIRKRFDGQAERCAAMHQVIQQEVNTLLQNGWKGETARHFNQEMEGELIPAPQRLVGALRQAGETTSQLAQLFNQAEEEAVKSSHLAGAGMLASFWGFGLGGVQSGTEYEARIEEISKNLGVTKKQVTAYDGVFRGQRGEQFKKMVEWAAKEAGLNPGLLASSLIAETRRDDYLSKDEVSTFVVGTDDFYTTQEELRKHVPAFSKIGWDENQIPIIDTNERGRKVKSIHFDSGRDALLASAVYLKYGEEVLRKEAASSGINFDELPVETRYTLTRLAFNAGLGRGEEESTRGAQGAGYPHPRAEESCRATTARDHPYFSSAAPIRISF